MRTAGRKIRRDWRRHGWRWTAVLLAGLMLVGAGCGETTPVELAVTGPLAPPPPTDQLNSSELGLSMAMPRALRVAARSPEDHELRLAGRAGEIHTLAGRLTLITREGREAVMRDAMRQIDDTWNHALFVERLTAEPSFRPELVPDFYPPGENGLTIIKKRLSARKPLPTPRDPDSIDHEPNEVRMLALAYFVVVQPTDTPGTGTGVGTVSAGPQREKYMLAMFVLENTPQSEQMIDAMIKSLRNMQ